MLKCRFILKMKKFMLKICCIKKKTIPFQKLYKCSFSNHKTVDSSKKKFFFMFWNFFLYIREFFPLLMNSKILLEISWKLRKKNFFSISKTKKCHFVFLEKKKKKKKFHFKNSKNFLFPTTKHWTFLSNSEKIFF